MEKNREVKVIAVVALLVAVVGLSVAYAALSTTLEITGQATINSASWNVQFVEGTGTPVGGASATTPTVTSTSISNLNVTLTKPGDSYTYTFSIQNTGSINAKLGTVNIGTISCTSENSDEANATCQDLTYSVSYADGTPFTVGDALDSQATKQAKLTISYNADADTVPAQPVTVTGLTATLIYDQA